MVNIERVIIGSRQELISLIESMLNMEMNTQFYIVNDILCSDKNNVTIETDKSYAYEFQRDNTDLYRLHTIVDCKNKRKKIYDSVTHGMKQMVLFETKSI